MCNSNLEKNGLRFSGGWKLARDAVQHPQCCTVAKPLLEGSSIGISGQVGKYRLRVGDYRVLFTLEKDLIFIHLVKDRKDAYRD
jgi:hypothetical protein